MITKKRVATILRMAFPILIALSSVLAMSLIDLAMIRPLGNRATAAAGLAVFCNTLVLAFVMGIAPAVQGIVARRRGQNSAEPKCLPLNAGLLTAFVVGAPLTIVCYHFTPLLFSLISSDPEVTRTGIPFLRALYTAIVGFGMNAAFRGNWAGLAKMNVYMWIILVMSCLNFTGNYVLIFGHFGAPALGATGAAISTAVSCYAGLLINFVITYRRFRRDGFLTARPRWPLLTSIVRLALPAASLDFFFSIGYIVFFWMVGQVGTAELAAANVLIRITMVLAVLAMSLGVTSATLVSRTIGEGDPTGAAEWGWDAGKLGVILITLLGLPLLLFPKQTLAVFLSNPHTISIAILPLQMVAATTGFGSLIYIFSYTLASVGDGKRVIMISFITQWLVFLPAVWFVGPHLRYGLLQIWLVQMAYGALATALITALWADGKWKKIRI